MNTRELIEADQIEREDWQGRAIRAYKAHRYEECLKLLASNMRDKGDIEDFIDNFCAEASPMRAGR